VVHRRLDVALGAEVLGAVVVEVVVGGREVSVEGVEVARLLHAVPDRRELVREVLATGVGGVEVRLDDQSQATAHDAVAVLAAELRTRTRRRVSTSVCNQGITMGVERKKRTEVCMRETLKRRRRRRRRRRMGKQTRHEVKELLYTEGWWCGCVVQHGCHG
jgi:hypothetical protein